MLMKSNRRRILKVSGPCQLRLPWHCDCRLPVQGEVMGNLSRYIVMVSLLSFHFTAVGKTHKSTGGLDDERADDNATLELSDPGKADDAIKKIEFVTRMDGMDRVDALRIMRIAHETGESPTDVFRKFAAASIDGMKPGRTAEIYQLARKYEVSAPQMKNEVTFVARKFGLDFDSSLLLMKVSHNEHINYEQAFERIESVARDIREQSHNRRFTLGATVLNVASHHQVTLYATEVAAHDLQKRLDGIERQNQLDVALTLLQVAGEKVDAPVEENKKVTK